MRWAIRAFASATFQKLATLETERAQSVDDILPLVQVSRLQYAGSVTPLMHLIVRRNVIGDEMERYHAC